MNDIRGYWSRDGKWHAGLPPAGEPNPAYVSNPLPHFRAAARHDLCLTAAMILLMAQGRGRTLTTMAEECGVTCAALTNMVHKLVSRGLVTREKGWDKRAWLIQLTPEGAAVVSGITEGGES